MGMHALLIQFHELNPASPPKNDGWLTWRWLTQLNEASTARTRTTTPPIDGVKTSTRSPQHNGRC